MQPKSYCPLTQESTGQQTYGLGPSKRHKYDENYIDLWFTYIGSSAFPLPQSVICAKVLSHISMKPLLLDRHLETKHANLKNKPQEFFERELRRLSNCKTCMKATDTINKKGLEALYMVSYRVARTDKPHTIVEDFILPAAAIWLEQCWGKRPKKLYRQ